MKHYEKCNPKPEFIVGLAGPVGTDLKAAAQAIGQELRIYDYRTFDIRVSDLLRAWSSAEIQETIRRATEEKRIDYLMNAADHLRTQMNSGAALIPLITTAVRHERQKFLLEEGCDKDYEEVELYNHCYIINSLKHPDEVDVLRKIYGRKFVMISVNVPLDVRARNLREIIAKSYGVTDDARYLSEADRLMDKDRKRSGDGIGQNISGTFHLADVFLRGDGNLSFDVRRFFRILFGHPNATPTRDEYVMYEAKSNALRSADLSRQVGAVITNERKEIVSRGCNEVPVAGGDSFWPEDESQVLDTRDYAGGKDYNAVKKFEIICELIEFLKNKNWGCPRTLMI